MSFLAPILLFWLPPLAALVLLLYLLKLKRREVEVSSVFLWRQVIQDVQANAPFQKLRKNLLLLLQLLFLLFLIVAIARPFVWARALGGENVVLILDGSASMQSRDEGGERFDAARRTARRMIEGMNRGDAMMILLATSRARVLVAFTTDRGALLKGLAQARPADTETRLRESLVLGMAAIRARRSLQEDGNRIYVLSDGAFPEMEDLALEGVRLEYLKFGRRSENVGIVAMDVRRAPSGEGLSAQTFVALRNAGSGPKKAVLSLSRGDNLLDVREVTVPPRGQSAEVIATPGGAGGLLVARLEVADDLEADNVAYTEVAARRDVNLLLVSAGNFFLERALVLDPRVRATRVAPDGYRGQTGYDVVVFDRVAPASVGPGNALYIGAAGAGAPVVAAGEMRSPAVLDLRSHPVTRFVTFPSDLVIDRAQVARPVAGAETLVEARGGPLLVAAEREGRRSLYLAFGVEPRNSTLGLKVAFPILVSNAVQWLATRPGERETRQYRAGDVVPIAAPQDVTTVAVTDPEGRRAVLRAEGGTALYDATERRGVYRAEVGGERRAFAVNLLSSAESDTRPSDRIALGRHTVAAGGGATRTTREIWRWGALLALLLLAIEWYIYHRRV
jgi:Ca-activated chloride channel family protein